MNYKSVVTSFLQSGDKILLLRRSGKVGTYGGRWAAVSGFLEDHDPSPLARAKIEIEEELSLKSDQVTLVRAGEPLRVLDETADLVWVVHPFLFNVKEEKVKPDWEHSEFRWIHPDELVSYETVPKLRETFDRVEQDMQSHPDYLKPILLAVEDLAQDRVHGASILGQKSLQLIIEAARVSRANSVNELFHELMLVAFRLRKTHRCMATIPNLIGKLLYHASKSRTEHPQGSKFKEHAISIAEGLLRSARAAAEKASINCKDILSKYGRVLTHSYSSQVYRAIEFAAESGAKLEVYVTESSPGDEGRRLAKDLSYVKIPVTVIFDSAVASTMPDVDVVLVGADSVLWDGYAINKLGTKNLALAAKSESVPFYVVCETLKFNPWSLLGEPIQLSDSNPMVEHPAPRTKYTDTYFDLTSSDHIIEFITEEGHVKPNQVQGYIKRMLPELYA